MRRPTQRRQGLCKVMKTCALVLAMLFIDSAHEHLTFVGGGCNPFQPPTRFDARLPTRLKAQVRNASPQKRRILPPLGDSADVQKHVFISLTDYNKKIDKLVEGDDKVVFLRGGVATGKTTLAEHLAREFPEKYVNVPATDECSEQAWKSRTVEAIEERTKTTVERNSLEFSNALKIAKANDLTLIYDEARTVFASATLCFNLFKSNKQYRTKVLLFSASGDASTASGRVVSTPAEITQKYMWIPPLSNTQELETQLEEAGVRLDQKSIQFFMRFCGGHRGIFIATMHWVQSKQSKQSKQRSGKGWDFRQTVGFVRNSYNGGDWDCASNEILGYLQKSRAVRVNGLYEDVSNVPRVRAQNPLLASYYFHNLKKRHSLQVQFERGKPQHCADLLMRALPYLLFSQVVSFEGNTSELAKDGLPGEEQCNQAICTVLKDMGFQPVSTKRSRKGEGNPDIALEIGGERFVLEGVKLNGNITEHLQRFDSKTNYKNAKHKALYIIGNDSERMLDKVKKTTADDVQVIGLVPNIAHTGYTVHVKSKGIKSTNKFTVDCDLVARRLVLKDDGKPELHSVQSLKSINLPPKAETRPLHWFCAAFLSVWCFVRSFGVGYVSFFIQCMDCQLQEQCCLQPIGLSPARQCRLATIRCGVGLSAGKPCLDLTSSCEQFCLPCIHVLKTAVDFLLRRALKLSPSSKIKGVCGATGKTDGCELDCSACALRGRQELRGHWQPLSS
ncbi:unnamed protein product [Effrenium voratum]|uniref:AAA+ ATPase domain-containing protein n=1 Tax=Effrenium voratum TaxID=2562239 RepID=A0AA36NFS2_9DINO|nr:unnamed protein product [Effrenium voratum]